MTILIFRTDGTDLFHNDKPLTDIAQPRAMRISAKLFTSEWRCIASLDTLIKPEGWVPNAGAAATHGITVRQCNLYGARPRAAVAVMMDMVRCAKEVAAWGEPYHSGVIDVELLRLGARPDEWLRGGLKRTDILRLAADKLNGGRVMKLPDAVNRMSFDVNFTDRDDKLQTSIEILRGLRP